MDHREDRPPAPRRHGLLPWLFGAVAPGTVLLLAGGAAALAAEPGAGAAVTITAPCPPHEVQHRALTTVHGRLPVGAGMDVSRSVAKLYVDPASRDWTLLLLLPDGGSCAIATGTDWRTPRPPVPPPAPQAPS